MKKLAITLITIISLCSADISEGATRYVTVVKKNANGTFPMVTLTANEVAFIEFLWKTGGSAAWLNITKDGNSLDLTSLQAILSDGQSIVPIAGPVTFSVYSAAGDNEIWATIRIEPNPNINGVGQ